MSKKNSYFYDVKDSFEPVRIAEDKPTISNEYSPNDS